MPIVANSFKTPTLADAVSGHDGWADAWSGPIVGLGLAGASVVIDKYWQR